jgi:15-cis-phytoene synthase
MTNPSLDKNSQHFKKILSKNGKTFYWASFFLKKEDCQTLQIMYAFCRYVDDIVDAPKHTSISSEVDNQNKISALQNIQSEITSSHSKTAVTEEIIRLIQTGNIKKSVVDHFILGQAWDLSHSIILSETELFQYCYGVASTVGLLICNVFGITNKNAIRHAADLGIAMQLTNIARDVHEDAVNNRVYLPQSWFEKPLTPTDILHDESRKEEIFQAIQKLLRLADTYYQSTDKGMVYLPFRARSAMLVAAKVYKKIGDKILRLSSSDYWKAGRVYTSLWEKTSVTCQVLFSLFTSRRYYSIKRVPKHQKALHTEIETLINEVI